MTLFSIFSRLLASTTNLSNNDNVYATESGRRRFCNNDNDTAVQSMQAYVSECVSVCEAWLEKGPPHYNVDIKANGAERTNSKQVLSKTGLDNNLASDEERIIATSPHPDTHSHTSYHFHTHIRRETYAQKTGISASKYEEEVKWEKSLMGEIRPLFFHSHSHLRRSMLV